MSKLLTHTHLVEHDLVVRDWEEIIKSSQSERCSVITLRDRAQGPILGIVWSELRRDRYLRVKVGAISWIYVAPSVRGRGYGAQLLKATHGWMRDLGVEMREVFVTEANEAAVKSYKAQGYQVVDHRMLAPPPPVTLG